jgi:hypothetical protein
MKIKDPTGVTPQDGNSRDEFKPAAPNEKTTERYSSQNMTAEDAAFILMSGGV